MGLITFIGRKEMTEQVIRAVIKHGDYSRLGPIKAGLKKRVGSPQKVLCFWRCYYVEEAMYVAGMRTLMD